MAQNYTRQSSFSDGDTITAALFNDEFDQIVNAFAYSSTDASATGHTHDGSAGQGGGVSGIGDLDLLNKIAVDSTNNRWGFFVEVASAAVEQVRIQDGAIVPVTDNDIDLGTSSVEFKDAFFDGTVTSDAFAGPLTGAVTGNADTATTATLATSVTVSANNSTDETTYPVFVDGATGTQGAETDTGFTYNPSSGLLTIGGELDAASLDISGSADIDGTMEADAYTVDGTALNEYIADTVGAMVTSNTETNITVTYQDADNTLDFVALGTITALNNATENELVTIGSTTTELDAESGLTYDGSVLTVSGEVDATSLDISGDADIDGTLETDALSINSTAVTSTAAELNILDGVTSTAAELNILDGVTSTAAELNILDGVTASATDINLIDGITNGTAIASKAIITDANIDITGGRNITISGELDAGSLDISGDADIDGTLEADAYTVDGTALNEYIADTVGAMVTSNTETDITVTYDDGDNTLDFVVGNISGTAGLATSITASANNSTDETVYPTFVDGATGTQGIETDTGLTYNPSTGVITATQFTGAVVGNVTGNASGTAATVTGGTQASITSAANLVTVGTIGTGVWQGTAIAGGYIANDAIDSQHYADGSIDNAHIADDAIDSEHYADGSIDNAHLADDAVDTDEIADNAVSLAKMAGLARGKVIYGDSSGNPAALALGSSGYVLKSDGTDIAWAADEGLSTEEVQDIAGGMMTGNTESGITVTYQDGDGTVDFTVGTLNQDTTGTADNFTATANNSTDETVYPVFVDGATGSQGAETDTGLYYNPSTGMLTTAGVTATFTGNITGNVTGNTSGTAATVTTAAQSNITSLGTLTTLTVDDVVINGATIGHGDDTDLITVADGIATVAGEISVTTLDIGGTNVTSTAAELNILDGVNSTAAELNIMDGGTAASSTTLEDADRLVVNDNGTMKQVAMTDFDSDRFSIVTSAPGSGTGKRTGHVWYVV